MSGSKCNFDFDELKMYFGEPYLIQMPNNHYIEIMQPSIGDILYLGDKLVYSTIAPFTGNTTTYRVQLWDNGIDWNKISDYELFLMLTPNIKDISFIMNKVTFVNNPEYDDNLSEEDNYMNGQSKYIKTYSKIDFSNLKPYKTNKLDENGDLILDKNNEPKQEIVLCNVEQNIMIDEQTYLHIREYLRMMFNQHPKEELAKGKLAKQWLIEHDKDNLKLEMNKNGNASKSVLLPLVSGLINHPGFKYDLDGIKKLGIFAFMDSVQRLQIYQQSIAFLGGMYSGMMDTSKMGEEELNKRINWLQDIYQK